MRTKPIHKIIVIVPVGYGFEDDASHGKEDWELSECLPDATESAEMEDDLGGSSDPRKATMRN